MFFSEFCKIFSSDRTVLVFVYGFWDDFQNTSFTDHLGETAILWTSCRNSITRYSNKNYFRGAFQVFYKRSRSSHSKAFIYLKSLKTVCEEVNLLWSCEMPTRNFTKKKLFHTPSFKYFAFIFAEYIKITSAEEALKVWEHNISGK